VLRKYKYLRPSLDGPFLEDFGVTDVSKCHIEPKCVTFVSFRKWHIFTYLMIGAQRNEEHVSSLQMCLLDCSLSTDRLNDADLSSLLLVLCAASADPWASWLAGCRMSERRRRAARCTRPASLCTAVVR
jgi:hypothetical protein